MSIISRVHNKIRNTVWQKKRGSINQRDRDRLNESARTASILCCNCTGGILSHDLGLQFRSPTVNLFMRAEDFIRFCENLKDYLAIDEFVECKDPEIIGARTYPIAYLGDLTVFFVHYHSVEEAQKKWNERKKRINWDNIVIFNTDREGMTDILKDRFEALPYKKVMFTHLPDEVHQSCFYLKGYEQESSVGIITDHSSWDGLRPVDQFDYIEFLNRET